MKFYFLSFISFALLMGCQSQPTKTFERGAINHRILARHLGRPINIGSDTVLIDARSRFDHSMTRPKGSIFMAWDEFSQPGNRLKGKLQTDLLDLAKRLAVKGIGPQTPVVILGRGQSGEAHEGRLAWMLAHLGIQDIQIGDINSVNLRYTNVEKAPTKGVPPWEPAMVEHLLADAKEVGKQDFLVDVRSSKEYFLDNYGVEGIHIHWKEFFTTEGKVNPKIRTRLKGIGLKKSSRIIVVSDQGVRSGAVAFALTALGYKNVGNLAGGFEELKYIKRR